MSLESNLNVKMNGLAGSEVYVQELSDVIMRCEIAISNQAEIKSIIATGAGRSNRDINFEFSAEESKPILEAVIAVLRAKASP